MIGEMAEWSIAVVLKTIVPKGTGGSNPSLSATLKSGNDRWDEFRGEVDKTGPAENWITPEELLYEKNVDRDG